MKPIISVVVLSYNSEKTIIETLDSILLQSYGANNIELIITDDYSIDGTISTINTWIEIHQQSFFSVEVTICNKNGGVSINCNNGWKKCSTEWVKTIAGDDILLNNCLESNYLFVSKNENCKVLFSNASTFSDNNVTSLKKSYTNKEFFNLSAKNQYKSLLMNGVKFSTPTSFINRQLLNDVGLADERFPMCEDYPLWLKITKNGTKLLYANVTTILYRESDSLSNSVNKIANPIYLKSLESIYKYLIWPEYQLYHKIKIFDDKVMFFSKKLCMRMFNNNKNNLSNMVYMLFFLIRPYSLFFKLKKIL